MNKPEPRSICTCRHTGDGPGSQHAGQLGHGFCLECSCDKFTWQRYLKPKDRKEKS